jgi:hypothetical protein
LGRDNGVTGLKKLVPFRVTSNALLSLQFSILWKIEDLGASSQLLADSGPKQNRLKEIA